MVDSPINFIFDANTFQDLDGDGLTYSAKLAGEQDLPLWLNFDPLTRTFSGTPLAENVGTLSVEVTADDGNGGSVSDIFDIVISAANNIPTVINPIVDQAAPENILFSFEFPNDVFQDLDGDGLSFSALLVGGGDLPAWLVFDPLTRTFSGTPLAENVGTLSVEVTADDGNGGAVSDIFDIVISAANN
ncbi:putative Ig domain-containing protein, partial [Aquiflexum sp. XJ19-10]|nr:putative Ig domain-containing protein [Aquiflexum gelatinilyticum]